ncbi:hypothetical protein DL96DRAFT_1625064, partial [Flagelloscypha sp. PMI_526]
MATKIASSHSGVQFKFTKQWAIHAIWFTLKLFAMLSVIMAIVISYNLIACSFGRHILSRYRLWEGTIPPDADSKAGYLIAATVAGILAGVSIFPLFIAFIFLPQRGVPLNLRLGPVVVSKRFAHWSLFAGVIVFSWTFVIIAGAVMHRTYSYVTPLSMLGIYAFGTLLALPSVAFLALVIIVSL